ncbi:MULTISPECIES: SRPBCC family protein [Mumia]|uniref:SRPBCC family protein n=1 Tax=Mumia TaxID=1546255 RepID=UPI0014226142|nr:MULTISPECIES: SRPBCC family protein [unclassified Mumia]QMW67726.1 SRPBCC family protein [Mumia sp. ZJ1417]
MTDQTTSDIVVDAEPSAIMAVIADFATYPTWATGVKEAQVVALDEFGARATQVQFILDATPIRDTYTLAYTWDGDHKVEWEIAEPGAMLKGMDGAYVLDALGGGSTRVTYRLAVEVSIPLLGMLRRKAEKVIIDTALKGLKKRVESTPE